MAEISATFIFMFLQDFISDEKKIDTFCSRSVLCLVYELLLLIVDANVAVKT